MKMQVLLPTGGTGERMKAALPKPLLDLAGKPVVLWALEVFERSSLVDSIVLIVHTGFRKEYEALVTRVGLRKVRCYVEGGSTRTGSVRNGIRRLDKDTDIVLVHDGVRPLVTEDIIARGLELMPREKAVVAAVPVKSTIKTADPGTFEVRETLDRDSLWEVQTPQIFDRSLLERAYARGRDDDATDDAALVEALGVKVKLFPGDYRNVKITTPEDLLIVEAFLRSLKG